MIDTVRMSGEYQIMDLNLSTWTNESSFFNNAGLLEDVYYYKVKGEPMIKYFPNRMLLIVELSIPKFLYGNNVKMVASDDIPIFFRKLDEYLRVKFSAYPQHGWYNWKVKRMDVCCNFQVGGAVRDYVKAFSQIFIPKYSTCVYGMNETVEWRCKSKRMQFYDKEQEVITHGGGAELAEMARGILRFEANVRSKTLEQYSPFRWAGELFREDVARALLLKHLHRLGIDRLFTISNKYEMARTLEEAYGPLKTQDLLGFILYREIFGQDSLSKLSRSTYDRRMSDLRRLGLAPFFSDMELPPLDLSPLAGLKFQASFSLRPELPCVVRNGCALKRTGVEVFNPAFPIDGRGQQ